MREELSLDVMEKRVWALPVHPELDGDAAAGSVVAGEAGCGGKEPVHSLQGLRRGSEAPDPPVLTASWMEEGSPHGNPAYQKTANKGIRDNYTQFLITCQ